MRLCGGYIHPSTRHLHLNWKLATLANDNTITLATFALSRIPPFRTKTAIIAVAKKMV